MEYKAHLLETDFLWDEQCHCR